MSNRREQIAELVKIYAGESETECWEAWPETEVGYCVVRPCHHCLTDRILSIGLDTCPLRLTTSAVTIHYCHANVLWYGETLNVCSDTWHEECPFFKAINAAIKGEDK